jgi:2-iminobutanoate/2-iminopropanoate deaminase
MQTLANVEAILIASGSSISQLVSVRVYITTMERWPEFNLLYATWVGSARPSRAVVPVPELHFGFEIEIEAVAAL